MTEREPTIEELLNSLTQDQKYCLLVAYLENKELGFPEYQIVDGETKTNLHFDIFGEFIPELIKRGFLKTYVNNSDNINWYTLTEKGKFLAEKIDEDYMEEVIEIFDNLTKNESECLFDAEATSDSIGIPVETEAGEENEQFSKHKPVIDRLIELELITYTKNETGKSYIVLTKLGQKLLKYTGEIVRNKIIEFKKPTNKS
jgi:predicted transcriptional regulator